jgi:ubiquinone/menaquinone biosynthesis C-methylase UbiE
MAPHPPGVPKTEKIMTATTTPPDLSVVKSKQQQTWSSGDYSMVAARIVLASERLADVADLRAGSRVLDVACGSGNATIAAARHNTQTTGVDYAPNLLEDARARAAAEGLDIDFRAGDAEQLPFDDSSFDTVLSVFGSMFAPDHHRTASEMVRVAKPGGRIALASWTPTGFIGQMFGVIRAHVPGPAGLESPMLWGVEDHLRQIYGEAVADIQSTEQIQTFRHTGPQEFVEFFHRWYGPTLAAFAALDPDGRESLSTGLVELANEWDSHDDGGSICLPSEYLETVITLR